MQKGSCLCAKWSCTVEPLCTLSAFYVVKQSLHFFLGEARPGSAVPARSFSSYIVLNQLDKLLLAGKHSVTTVGYPRSTP